MAIKNNLLWIDTTEKLFIYYKLEILLLLYKYYLALTD